MVWMAVSTEPNAVKSTMGISGMVLRNESKRSKPETGIMRISLNTVSYVPALALALLRASMPSQAISTAKPAWLKASANISRFGWSSSTTRIDGGPLIDVSVSPLIPDGQIHSELRSVSHFTLHGEPAAAVCHHAVTDRQPQSRSSLVVSSREKRLEYSGQVLWRNPIARVGYD